MAEHTVIIKEEFYIKNRGKCIIIDFAENGLPDRIKRKDLKNYYKLEDVIDYENVKYRIIGIETFATYEISDCGFLLEELK